MISDESGFAKVHLKVTFPPNGVAIFGISHPFKWSIDIKTHLNPNEDGGTLPVKTSLGHAINAKFSYLRTLPRVAARD